MDPILSFGPVIQSCNDALDYPKNLIRSDTYEFILDEFYDRLNSQAPRLFHPEKKASVDFLEFAEAGNETVTDAFEMREQLGLTRERPVQDPRCRFMFIRATHSRERLKITRLMLTLALSYHQINPVFLNFVHSFGRREYAQDFFFTAFHVHHANGSKTIDLAPSLGRSGQCLQMCFGLKSVEKSKYQEDWPWAHRQCALHHSFDIVNGRMLWILIEADPILKRRISSATGLRGLPEIKSVHTVESSLRSSLATLLIICEWASANWRWYINFLEDKCQRNTRQTLSKHVDTPSSPTLDEESFQMFSRRNTQTTDRTTVPLEPGKRSYPASPSSVKLGQDPYDSCDRPLPNNWKLEEGSRNVFWPPDKALPDKNDHVQPREAEKFITFDDLQEIQHIEESINDVSLILKLNIGIVEAISNFYEPSNEDQNFPEELVDSCHTAMKRFCQKLHITKTDLQTQALRTETLMRLLASRKSLTHGIFDVQNMEANQKLAFQGQLMTWQAKRSAQNMEKMTNDMSAMTLDMNEIAKKTKLETISMRIITLITLFFLPGTFISLTEAVGQTQRLYSSEPAPLFTQLLSVSILHVNSQRWPATGLHSQPCSSLTKAMEGDQHDDDEAIQDFLDWVQDPENRYSGHRDILDDVNCSYISFKRLKEYLSQRHRTRDLLRGVYYDRDEGDLPRVDASTCKHLRIFSILLCTRGARHIDHFLRHEGLCDQNLPFLIKPPYWPKSTDDTLFKAFQEQQWLFCPQYLEQLGDGREFNDKRVLPFKKHGKMWEGGSAIVQKIEVEDEYNKLGGQRSSATEHERSNIFVIKTYRTKAAKSYYKNECQAFKRLRIGNRPPRNIVHFYGHWEHLGTYNVILEYADKGTLEDLITTTPPSTAEDILVFWDSLLDVAYGLDAIHNTQSATADLPYIMLGWHQDLKPSNILLFSSGHGSRYRFVFKIADLGVSHFRKHSPEIYGRTDPARSGTHTYVRPSAVEQTIDLWSLGCIYSVVATWVANGSDMVAEYRQKRQEEISIQYGIPDSDCFYREREVLKVVGKRHKDAIADLRPRDFVTKSVLNMLVDNMLQEPQGRLNSKQVLFRSTKIIAKAKIAMEKLKKTSRTDSYRGEHEERLSSPNWSASPSPSGSIHEDQKLTEAHSRHPSQGIGAVERMIGANEGSSSQRKISSRDVHFEQPNHVHQPDDKVRTLTRPHRDNVPTLDISSASGLLSRPQDEITSRDRGRIDGMLDTSSQRATPYGPFMSNGQIPLGGAGGHARSSIQSVLSRATPELDHKISKFHSHDPFAQLTLEQGLDWKLRRENSQNTDSLNEVLLGILRGRDHSMAQYRDKVRRVLELLSYIAAWFDPNRIEVYYSTSLEKSRPRTNAEVLAVFDQKAFSGVPDFKSRFSDIILDYQRKLPEKHRFKAFWDPSRPKQGPRKLSFIILTDGVWRPKCDLTASIRALISKLEKHEFTNSQIGIQFVRFGDDEREQGRLQMLDSGLGSNL
ncbi:uncharacterized protein KY384_002747 [Bacidia gigantensis]|uniref:uncharacterized protein n=1 Tax=Bacidia gigantensis TaxID=2732470 RepID=UPI001D04C520|nr:uncharacterized protein KY384_002747 [Bacidia gigantensis]KAG8532869.1 hypothetical protein KY384_002747 [Bacidia gigantensis]